MAKPRAPRATYPHDPQRRWTGVPAVPHVPEPALTVLPDLPEAAIQEAVRLELLRSSLPTDPPTPSSRFLSDSDTIPAVTSAADMVDDPQWSPVFSEVEARAGPRVALYCALAFMGWPEPDALTMVYPDGAPTTWDRTAVRTWMAFVVSRLFPMRMWTLSRIRQFVDDPNTDPSIRVGLLRFLAHNFFEAEKHPPNPKEEQATVWNSPSMALTDRINEVILSRGAAILIPAEGRQVEGGRVVEVPGGDATGDAVGGAVGDAVSHE